MGGSGTRPNEDMHARCALTAELEVETATLVMGCDGLDARRGDGSPFSRPNEVIYFLHH